MTPYLVAFFFFAVGVGVGLFFFSALKRTVRLFIGGGASWRIVALYLFRFAVTGLAFFWASRFGAVGLISAACGFTFARLIAVRKERSDNV